MSAAAWTPQAKERLQLAWLECVLTRAAISTRRRQCIEPIAEHSVAQQKRLAGLNRAGEKMLANKVKVDALSRCLCRHRDSLGSVVVSVPGLDGEVLHYLFVLGCQSPLKACFLTVTALEPISVFESCGAQLPRFLTSWAHVWQMHLQLVHVGLPLLAADDLSHVQVVTDVCFLAEDMLVSDAEPTFADDLITILEGTGASLKPQSSSSSSDTDQSDDDPAYSAPWVLDFLRRQTVSHSVSTNIAEAQAQETEGRLAKKQKLRATEGDAPKRLSVGEALPEDVLQCWEELQTERDVWKAREIEMVRDFKVSVLGGAWTKRALGRDFDAVKIAAGHAAAARWCELYGLQASARYDLQLYGRELAGALAHAWGHRMQFYYDLFVDSEADPFVYDPSVHEAYTEPEELAASFGVAGGRAVQRLEQIRAIRPAHPR